MQKNIWLATFLVAFYACTATATPTPFLFTVDPAQSLADVDVDAASAGFSDSDSDSTRLAGTFLALIDPEVAPFSTARIVAMDVTNVDGLDMSLSFGGIFGAILNLAVESSDLEIHLTEPGGVGAVDGNGRFTQADNGLQLIAHATASCTGLLCGTVDLPPTFDVDDTTTVDFDNCRVTQTGQLTTLFIPVAATFEQVDNDGNTLTFVLDGQLVGTGVAIPEPSGGLLLLMAAVAYLAIRPSRL